MRIILSAAAVLVTRIAAQCGPAKDKPYPPGTTECPAGPGGGGGGGGGGVTCPDTGGYTGSDSYKGSPPYAAPTRGSLGCVDAAGLAKVPTGTAGTSVLPASNIYGPMEAGFSSAQPGADCLGNNELPGGVDTNLAEHVMNELCKPQTMTVLNSCGGHAKPFHYHENMACLYDADPTTKHSTRIGTAADGNGIYGRYINDGVQPTDLDACGGRTGVTPDSNGASVYYYVVTGGAPFTVGCFGPATLEQCRALYSSCDGVVVSMTTEYGTDSYDLDCPCFDKRGSNVPSATCRPKFLAPLSADTTNGQASLAMSADAASCSNYTGTAASESAASSPAAAAAAMLATFAAGFAVL